MNRSLRALTACLLSVLCLLVPFRAFAAGVPVTALVTDGEAVTFPEDWPVPPDVTAPSVIVADADTGALLYAKNPDATCDPGSNAKLMTALLTLENLPLTGTVTFSARAVQNLPPGAAYIGIRKNEELTVRDCLYGLLLPGANEVANALAEAVKGDSGSFAVLMNERSGELTAYNTQYSGPTGLASEPAVTTAYDLLLLFEACLAEPSFAPIVSASSYTIGPTNVISESRVMANTCLLCRHGSEYFDARVQAAHIGGGADGTVSLAVCASDGDRRVLVVLTGTTASTAYEEARLMMDFAFLSFRNVDAAQLENSFLVTGGAGNILELPRPEAGAQSVPEYSFVTLPVRADETALTARVRQTSAGTRAFWYCEGVPAGTALLKESAADFRSEYRHLEASERLPIRFFSLWIPVGAAAGFLLLLVLIFLLVRQRRRRKHFSMR